MDKITLQEYSFKIIDEILFSLSKTKESELQDFVNSIIAAKRIFCVGAGRSGILLRAFCMRLNHLGIDAFLVGDIPCPPANHDDLIIASSGSGTTATTLATLKMARKTGVKIAVITASKESEIALHADVLVNINAPYDLAKHIIGLGEQPMRSLFEQVSFIIYESIVSVLQRRLNIPEEKMIMRHANLE